MAQRSSGATSPEVVKLDGHMMWSWWSAQLKPGSDGKLQQTYQQTPSAPSAPCSHFRTSAVWNLAWLWSTCAIACNLVRQCSTNVLLCPCLTQYHDSSTPDSQYNDATLLLSCSRVSFVLAIAGDFMLHRRCRNVQLSCSCNCPCDMSMSGQCDMPRCHYSYHHRRPDPFSGFQRHLASGGLVWLSSWRAAQSRAPSSGTPSLRAKPLVLQAQQHNSARPSTGTTR